VDVAVEGMITWMMVPTSGLALISRQGLRTRPVALAAPGHMYYCLDNYGAIIDDHDGRYVYDPVTYRDGVVEAMISTFYARFSMSCRCVRGIGKSARYRFLSGG
jgi:hypothetical protein